MANSNVVTVLVAGFILTVLVFLAPPGLLRPSRHAFTPRNTHYSWVIKGAPLPGETADSSHFGGGGFQYMHMAMMERLPNGSLAVAFQASPTSYEGSVHQALFWSTSSDGGVSWSEPTVLVDDDQMPVWTPVLRAEGNRLWLIYTRSSRKCRYFDRSRGVLRHSPGGDLLYVASDDSGATWSSPQLMLPYDAEGGIPKVVANKMAVLGSGAWVLPFWREPGKTCPKLRSEVKDPKDIVKGSAGVLISGDQGLTWSVKGNLTSPGTWLIENTVLELGTRSLLQHFRTRKGVAYASVSVDGGETWSTPQRTSIPNPNSKMHTIRGSGYTRTVSYTHLTLPTILLV